MRIIHFFALLAVSFLFLSCRSFSYFESPNNLRNIEGTLHLRNGKTFTGKLIIQTESLFGSPVKLYAEGDKKPMQFKLDDVKAYSVRNNHYELKEIREVLSIGRRLLFMKRLTPEGSRLHLFEFMRKEIVNKTATRYHSEHYMQLPGEEESLVFATDGAAFVPNFEQKVSRLVSDCPPLAQKIASKEHGYYYHQVSLQKNKRLDVLHRIISEYNQCNHSSDGTKNIR
jgi:hypothetical protein